MKKRIAAFTVSAVTLTSCATSPETRALSSNEDNAAYVPPLKSVHLPLLWSGSVEPIIIGGSAETRAGVLRNGDWLRKETRRPSRQGRITAEISYRNTLSQQVVIPANTPVHAMQWDASPSLLSVLAQPTTAQANSYHNPIEWCFSIPTQAGCIFWENENSALYVTMIENTQRSLIGVALIGSRGAMPNIVEGEVDFGGPIVATDKIIDITEEGFKIASFVRDGRQTEKIALSRTLLWSNIDEVHFADFRFKPVRNEIGKIDAVEVLVATPSINSR